MNLLEILALISLVLISVIFILLIYLIFIRKQDDLFSKEIRAVEKNLRDEINDSLLKFNQTVNQQLISTNQSSNKNMSDFRLAVNQHISDFQEKINDKFNDQFKSLSMTFQNQMNQINQKVEERLNKGFKEANETFLNIAKRVEVIDQAQKNIKDLSEEMVSLQNILSNNQTRGAYGEYQLNQLLYSVYGDNNRLYQTQYTIKNDKENVRADAVVFMPKPHEMIAIDSKFPYAAYSKLFGQDKIKEDEKHQLMIQFGREVKKHITDVSSKYILPPKTTDYALMFVPSDGILSLLHSEFPNVIDYAREKNVTIVSPTTIIPLLSSFKAFAIDYERSKNMERINQELIKLGRDFRIFGKEWDKLSRSIQSVKKNSDMLDSRVEKIHSKFHNIQDVNEMTDEDDA
jgi:DNA recombination protein RmuC